MKRLSLLITSLLIVLTGTCQIGIDYKELMRDIMRLDSCQEVSRHMDTLLYYKDSLLTERLIHIHYLEGVVVEQDSVNGLMVGSLKDCAGELEKLSKPKPLWQHIIYKVSDPWVWVPALVAGFEFFILVK